MILSFSSGPHSPTRSSLPSTAAASVRSDPLPQSQPASKRLRLAGGRSSTPSGSRSPIPCSRPNARDRAAVHVAPRGRAGPAPYARLIASLLLALTGVGCMPQDAPVTTSSDPAQRFAAWQQCLERSYAEARKKTSDPIAAADRAFQTCEPQEWLVEVSALREGVTPDAFSRRKAEWKRTLAQTGRIS